MKVSFNRAALAEALGVVINAVANRTPKPILRCVRITTDEKSVKICATDLEVGINYTLSQVQIDKPGEVVIPADRLTAIVRESDDEILEMEAEEASCHIRGADSHFTIYGHDAGQFPVVPDFGDKGDIEVGLGKLQEAIEQSLFATAKESSRYAINGVLWEIKGKKLSLIATDGRRLAKRKLDLSSVAKDKAGGENIIVPGKTMALLDKITGDANSTVAIKLVDNQIMLGCNGIVISSNLVEGNFPKYEDIIPKDYSKKLMISTDAAISAVRRAALLTNEDSKGIKLAIDKDKLVISSRAPETGDAQIDMAIDYKGDGIEIGFNPHFLLEVLRVIKTPEFEMELSEADRPGLIKSGSNFLYVLMPINLG